MTSPVSIEDVKTALVSGSNDVGSLAKDATTKANKYAKWKPYQATELNLPTDEQRRKAGWDEFGRSNEEHGFYYGVRGGVGMVTSPTTLHNCKFTYEGPNGTSGECYRLTDWVHPTTPTLYGYRSDATIDLMADFIWQGEVAKTVITDQTISFKVHIKYSPHTAEEREEMLSIYDFLKKDTDAGTPQLEPTDCWPCVLVGNKLHGLYPLPNESSVTPGSNLAQLPQGDSWWSISLPSSDYHTGTSATMSIILVRCPDGLNTLGTNTPRLSGNTSTCIKNWITMGDDETWGAWFCGVPEGCGVTVTFATGGSYGATVANITGVSISTLTNTSLEAGISYQFSAPYTRSVTVTIGVTMTFIPRNGSSSTENIGSYTINVTNPNIRINLYQISKTLENPLYGSGTVTLNATISTTIGSSSQAGTPGDVTVNFPMS